ncbi:MAG: tetratricopeptide repeat protein [Candidatus Zixiibacteriota bacterium]|nr:MAG: tetratricopeptide repeat protein [candidate division Zixibacteria bacterium]
MRAWYYLFFFVSGATALIYETAFARSFSLVFGSTLASVSLVLAVFMGGMAWGAAKLGRVADFRSPARWYGLLEIAAGLCALLAILLVPAVRNLYSHLSHGAFSAPAARLLLQFLLAGVLLLPLTVILGATLPALARGLTATLPERFRRLSLLYGLNTFGAAAGTLLCGFILLEHLGYRLSVLSAVILNLAVGGVAIFLAPRLEAGAAEPDPAPAPKGSKTTVSPQPSRLLLLIAGLSGLAALGYEVVWFRVLSLSVVADAYAFALMLGIYLLGIGGGSLAAFARFRRREGGWAELGVMELLVSLCAVAGLWFLVQSDLGMARPEASDPAYWEKMLGNTVLQAVVLILPATLALGYLFPILLSLYAAHRETLGRQVGRIVAVNTLGAILGVLGAAYVLIPLLGMQGSLLALAGISAAAGFLALAFGPVSRGWRMTALGTGLPVVALALALFPMQPHFGFQRIPTHEHARVLFYRESPDQTVMVTEDLAGAKVRRLLLNQQQATSTVLAGQRKNQLLGHLPLWANAGARRALVICFGSGGTFGSLGLYDLERVDCVEICPDVLDAAPLFREWNGDVLSRPQVRVVVDDGRSHLLTTEQTYDVITLEPMHPGLKGVSSLYSLEFYREARRVLNPGGTLCQWIPLYGMSGEDARSLMATAVEVFPQSSLWLIGNEAILLCARDSLALDWDWMEERIADRPAREMLRKVYLDDPWAVLSGYLLGPEGLRDYTRGAPLLRDNRPFLEYRIPRHQHVSPWDAILSLSERRESPLPWVTARQPGLRDSLSRAWEKRREAWTERDRAFAAYARSQVPAARKGFEAALQSLPEDRYATHLLQEIYWRYGVEFSRRGQWEQALEAYRRAVQIDSTDAEGRFYLAVTLDHAGQRDAATRELEVALALRPDYPEARDMLARRQEPPEGP